jgi:hypothetical protein
VPMPNAAIDLDTPEDLKRLNGDILDFKSLGSGEIENVPNSPAGKDWSEATWLRPSGLELEENDGDETHAAHHRP